MKKLFFAVLVAVSFQASAAEWVSDSRLGCVSHKYAYEAVLATKNDDKKLWNYLLTNNKCTLIKDGLQMSVIDELQGFYKIRIYFDNDSGELWVPSPLIKK